MKPKEILGADEYKNFRNVRAAAILFVVLGSVLVLGGVANVLTDPLPGSEREKDPVYFGIALALVGAAGAIGGIATLAGSRTVSKLIYVMVLPYFLAFPVGTIMSYTLWTGLAEYLTSKERLKSNMSPNEKDVGRTE